MSSTKNIIICVVALILLGLLYYSLFMSNKTVTEGWVNYKQQPFGNIYTGSGNEGVRPLVFYDVPRFRRPYNWPVRHLVDYPVPHEHHDP